MAGIFKKAMGLFVEFEEEPAKSAPQKATTPVTNQKAAPSHSITAALNREEVDKFEKHFEKIFDQANLPGPDYYEFWKMMETLEAHLPDENARISATYAALKIQGLTKEKLIETALKYKELLTIDKGTFEKAANDKSERDIGQKQKDAQGLEEKIARNTEMIQKLTKEITEAQIAIEKLKTVITEEETKLSRNKQGYNLACEAMISKISGDIKKIETTL